MKILLVGGGSGGSVSPLLAVAEAIKRHHPSANFLFVGGKSGPDAQMANAAGLPFKRISAGKLRRYFSFRNFLSPFQTAAGFFEAKKIIREFKPDCVFGTGSYIQVPLVWAAKMLKVPVVLHQQDIVPSLANKLCQAAADKITVTFEKSLTDFETGFGLIYKKPKEKVVLTGNPFRRNLAEFVREDGIKFFHLKKDFPTLLVLGGGTGSEALNLALLEALPALTGFVQVIHVGGKGKTLAEKGENYHPYEFTNHMGEAYAAADIVVSRAGISTLTELSNLKKVSIIVPMPHSHQEMNGRFLKAASAAFVISQAEFTGHALPIIVRKLLFEYKLQKAMEEMVGRIMPKNADEKIAKIILSQMA
jgi:UDP-N-acetylglucosamine--N-acetylmuramyl-(pentapeptide) pyrophosphoryl-undecaprenol N-acetylglucosamine transferase